MKNTYAISSFVPESPYHAYQWPSAGRATRAEVLKGALKPEWFRVQVLPCTSPNTLHWGSHSKWVVLEMSAENCSIQDGLVDFQEGTVLFCGSPRDACRYLQDHNFPVPQEVESTEGPVREFIENPDYEFTTIDPRRIKSEPELLNEQRLLEELDRAFADVQREDGISLHETFAVDLYGTMRERRDLRKLDTDTNWREVKDEWIESINGVGGIAFLDELGFKYYLPAYLRWYIRRENVSASCDLDSVFLYHLTGVKDDDLKEWRFNRFRTLTAEQSRVVAEFLNHIAEYNHEDYREDISEALNAYWGRFLGKP